MPEPTLDKARTEACPIVMRRPVAEDGPAVSGLVGACPPLDENSRYCNLLQCTDFSDTCIVAERAGELVGWVSGYRLPAEPETLFVWQVAVHPDARGESLGKRMLLALLQRLSKSGVSALRTTVTKANKPSRAMFRSIAGSLDADMSERRHFEAERHFDGRHEGEYLIEIGRF
jgi:L-2,4-diaminobutyric acid acetyltransferase